MPGNLQSFSFSKSFSETKHPEALLEYRAFPRTNQLRIRTRPIDKAALRSSHLFVGSISVLALMAREETALTT